MRHNPGMNACMHRFSSFQTACVTSSTATSSESTSVDMNSASLQVRSCFVLSCPSALWCSCLHDCWCQNSTVCTGDFCACAYCRAWHNIGNAISIWSQHFALLYLVPNYLKGVILTHTTCPLFKATLYNAYEARTNHFHVQSNVFHEHTLSHRIYESKNWKLYPLSVETPCEICFIAEPKLKSSDVFDWQSFTLLAGSTVNIFYLTFWNRSSFLGVLANVWCIRGCRWGL